MAQTEGMDDFEGGSGPAAGDGAERLPLVPGFTVVRLLGRGGSAAVWLVADNITAEEFALKVLAADAAVCHELQREIAFLGRYRHDHLIRVHRMLETDQGPGLLMDVAPRRFPGPADLSPRAAPVGEVITVLMPIAQALEYLHSQGVTHADVAPGNVLFTAQGKPLLSDLDMGRIVGEVRGSRQGTPGFIDPAGDPSAGTDAGRQHPEADVFALGALGWFALTGRVPAATQQRPPLSVLVPEVPGELMTLIESALQEDRSARPSAAEFAYSVFRTGQAAPLDLVAPVHPAVLPELVTRREVLEQKRSRLPLKRGLLQRGPLKQGRQGLRAKEAAAGSRGSHRDRGRGGNGTGTAVARRVLARNGAVAVSAAALVAVLAVALAPRVVQSVTAQEPAATATAVRSHSAADGGTGSSTDAGTDNGPDAGTDRAPADELPPEMTAALAGADAAAAVQALAAVRPGVQDRILRPARTGQYRRFRGHAGGPRHRPAAGRVRTCPGRAPDVGGGCPPRTERRRRPDSGGGRGHDVGIHGGGCGRQPGPDQGGQHGAAPGIRPPAGEWKLAHLRGPAAACPLAGTWLCQPRQSGT